jgi:hypothetical protein
MSVFQALLLAVFGLFWALEAVGHFALRNRPGGETISHLTRRWAHRLTGPWAHWIVWIPGALLIADLEGWL